MGIFGLKHLAKAICLFNLFTVTIGNYILLTPKSWQLGGLTQFCIIVDDSSAPEGEVTLNVTSYDRYRYPIGIDGQEESDPYTQHLLTTLPVPDGKVETCHELIVEDTDESTYNVKLHITGHLAGFPLNLTTDISFEQNDRNTIIQTDKFYYQPGQVVKFRILTHHGPLMNVSSNPYPTVFVTSPSRNRIAQWKNVDNSAGIVHLEMQLADEPEKGTYTIHVNVEETDDMKIKVQSTTRFKVEEYVLPRFEVTVEPPKYVLLHDESFSFKVCAKYTFGQPVNGDLSVVISNGGSRKCAIIITKNETISGCKEFEVSSSDLRTIDCSVNSVQIYAIVAEEGTGIKREQSGSVSVSRKAVTFKELYHDGYMKYNLPYSVKVKAQLPDDSPASGVLVEMCYDGGCTNITTPDDGIIKIHVKNYDSRRIVMKSLTTRADMRDSDYSTNIERYFSPSNSSLMIYAPEGEIDCTPGDVTKYTIPVLFATPDLSSAKIHVQLISRERIQFWSSEDYNLEQTELPFDGDYTVMPGSTTGSGKTGVVNIPLTLPHSVSPSASVLIWYIREDGEMVSDSRTLKMEKCLPNSVKLRWSTPKAQPGEEATLSITSEPSSICSLGVIDKSIELLNRGNNELTIDSFFWNIHGASPAWRGNSQVNDYRYCREKASSESGAEGIHYNYYTDYVDALKMFDDSGMYVFSNLHLENRPCERQERYPYRTYSSSRGGSGGYGGGIASMGMDSVPIMSESDVSYSSSVSVTMEQEGTLLELDSSSDPRTDFPETWLWDLHIIPPQGTVEQAVTIPDTITEWAGKAVCVHLQKGIGLSERVPITAFTPFFLDLTLPPSMKRGEILPVKISVFNYMKDALPVTVTVEGSDEYEILGDASAKLCVDSHGMTVHTVRTKPTAIGDVNITVSAFVDQSHASSCGTGQTAVQRQDALVKPIVVEAEGFPREKTWAKYICSDELSSGGDVLENWEVSAPSSGIVEGSDRGWMMVVGDLLALSVQNLGHLIRMPYGCGEQNMLNFAPNIYILQYLKASGQDAPEAKEKLLRFMRTGYQRQLLYHRRDNSYSAFGNADDEGSTFLTAFVLKSFAQAQEYITIDEESLNSTRRWLSKAQSEDGCFKSIGKVFNKAMRGGIKTDGSSVPLTAYVLISLLESNDNTESVKNATECLRTYTATDNPYILALKAYAFALAGDEETPILIDLLLSHTTDENHALYWKLSQSSWRSRSLEVETAGYAILAMLKWKPQNYEQVIRMVVKWISYNRNGYGGFISTQDTVVALQALASFEAHMDRGDLNAEIKVKTTDLTHSFKVTEDNKLLQQQVTIPSLPTTVHLEMMGEGCVLMQSVLRYNIPDPEPSDAFSLTVSSRTVRDKQCVTKELSICAANKLPGEKSNMVVIEINLVSGYIPEKTDLKKLVKGSNGVIKRYEVDGSKVSLYIEELTESQVCGSLRIIREIDMEEVKPGSVVVYDYYQPEYALSKSYKLPPMDDCLYAN